MDFELRWQKTQRIVWILATVFVAAGALGLFGRGPLSHASKASRSGNTLIEYERFARYRTPGVLEIVVLHPSRDIEVRIPHTLIETLKPEEIAPQPIRAVANGGDHVLTFAVDSVGSPARLRFAQEPPAAGAHEQWLEVQGERVSFFQLTYP